MIEAWATDWLTDRHKRIHRLLIGLSALFWLSSNIAIYHLAVVPKSGAKDQFYCTVYYITLNSNCKVQGVRKNTEDRTWSQN